MKTVFHGMSLSHLRDVNESQSDGLTPFILYALVEISYQFKIHYPLFQTRKRLEGRRTMYHIVTDETVILGISLSHLRKVNKSQSDGLTSHFLKVFEEITYHLMICFYNFYDLKRWQEVLHNVS